MARRASQAPHPEPQTTHQGKNHGGGHPRHNGTMECLHNLDSLLHVAKPLTNAPLCPHPYPSRGPFQAYSRRPPGHSRGVPPHKYRFLNDSGQNQAVGQEGLKISGVAGRQFRPAANGHRRNHAIGETAGTAARLVEQAGGQHGVGGQKGSGFGKICRAMASAGASSGPHKNSAQAMLLALQSSCACVQPRNFSWAAEPATTVWMRKLVSK